MCDLGTFYYFGYGVDKDYSEAVRLFKLATLQEHEEAQCNLGVCYKYGHGVEKDINEANKWIELATSQGYDYSESSLGAWDQEQES